MRVLYFGTYEQRYPRNAQVVAALRRTGVDVVERHVPVWEGREHKWRSGARAALRVAAAQPFLLRSIPGTFDAVIVGYPGHLDVAAAHRVAKGAPVVFNAMVSLFDTLVDDRARFRRGSLQARVLLAVDRRAFAQADVVVADTDVHADFLAELAGIPRSRVKSCFIGAEDDLFRPLWRLPEEFSVLFVGKLIPLHGMETVLEAARRLPNVRFVVIGSGQLDEALASAPANVQRKSWLPYAALPDAYAAAGCALGIFGTSGKAGRVIPNKAFQALACGTPLITADSPAARELLTNEEDALLVPSGDPAALAAAVARLASNPRLAQHLSARGLETYRRAASEEALGLRWQRVLEDAK
jgi:glycosyltransferase involved in cell wall biosynthesis